MGRRADRRAKRRAGGCWEGKYHDDASGKCRQCPVCGPGHRLEKICSFGQGGPSHCVPCASGYFNRLTNTDHQCWLCEDCAGLQRQVAHACTSEQNTICGHCLPGYTDNSYGSALSRMQYSCYPSPPRVTQTEQELIGSTPSWGKPTAGDVALQPRHPDNDPVMALAIAFPLVILLIIVAWLCYRAYRKIKTTRPRSVPSLDVPIQEWGPYPQQETAL